MRRLTAILSAAIALAAIATPAAAQSNDGPSWGVTAGIGLGYGTISKDTSREVKATYNGGLFAELPLSARWSFQPELKFDHRTISIGNVPTELNYVTLPLLFRNKIAGIYMVQGVSINTITSASIFDVDFKPVYNSPDIALIIGAGKRTGRLGLEVRWESGFRTFQKNISSGVRMRAITAVGSYHFK
jgi:hypothetical protein